MNTQERLSRIRARCVELLEIASKRTPGKWIAVPLSNSRCDVMKFSGGTLIKIIRGNDGCASFREAATPDGVFIAACAGPAEAGWKATIAAIDWIKSMEQLMQEADPLSHQERRLRVAVCLQREAILAAWPEETL